MKKNIVDYIKENSKKKALVFGTNIGASIHHIKLPAVYSEMNAQIDAILAFDDRFNSDFIITAMDLSVEAECFGCEVAYPEDNAPMIVKQCITDISEIRSMQTPLFGEKRTRMYLDIMKNLQTRRTEKPVIGGLIGPFTLASRLFGVSEFLELVLLDPTSASELIRKCTDFIMDYAEAIKENGIDGIFMAEPTAGLLSPKLSSIFSSAFIKEVVERVETPALKIIYHNCAASLVHLDSIFNSGASILHFGKPMHISAALEKNGAGRIISGNLDPAGVFLQKDSQNFRDTVQTLIEQTTEYSNFLISPGCDLPHNVPIENLEEFHALVRGH